MADTTALEAVAARRGGSSPLLGTIKAKAFKRYIRKEPEPPVALVQLEMPFKAFLPPGHHSTLYELRMARP